MSNHIAVLGIAAALLGAAALPGAAAAADLYGYGGDDRPLAFHGRDDIAPGGYGYRRGPGPVVFDERGGERRYGDDGWRGEARRPDWAYGGPAGYAPPPPPPYGYGPGSVRPAAVYGAAPGSGFGDLEGGCTVEQARSVTPAGWQKIVTHRTCYRR